MSFEIIFTSRRSYDSVVLGVVIQSVCPSVTRGLSTEPNNAQCTADILISHERAITSFLTHTHTHSLTELFLCRAMTYISPVSSHNSSVSFSSLEGSFRNESHCTGCLFRPRQSHHLHWRCRLRAGAYTGTDGGLFVVSTVLLSPSLPSPSLPYPFPTLSLSFPPLRNRKTKSSKIGPQFWGETDTQKISS